MTLRFVSIVAAAAMAAAVAVPARAEEDAGKALFQAKCATCHGKDGKGSPAMAKMFKVDVAKLNLASDEASKTPDADLSKVIVSGRRKMPSFKGKLTDPQISSVLGYVRSLAGKGQPEPSKTPHAPAK